MTAKLPMVFSIRPVYVEEIIRGRKRVEYRRRKPQLPEGEMFLIYETAPASMLVARAYVGGYVEGHPLDVYADTDGRGVSARDYATYFAGRDYAVAMRIARLHVLDEPVPLPPGMRAPQSWARLTAPVEGLL